MRSTKTTVVITLAAVLTLVTPPDALAGPKKRAAKPPAASAPRPARISPAWSVAFSPDGKTLAVGGYKRVVLYAAETGAKTAEWPLPAKSDAVRGLAFSPDGKLLAAGTGVPGDSGSVTVFDAATGKPVRTLAGASDTVEAVAFAVSGLLLSAANDEKVRLTDAATGKNAGVLAEHVGRCLSVAAPTSPLSQADGGAVFVTGGADSAVKVWDAKTKRVVVNFDQCQGPVWSLAFLPRPGRFAAASADGRVRVFGIREDPDAKTGDGGRTGFVERTLGGHEGGAYAVACSPDGKWIVTGGADKKVAVWQPNGNRGREMTEATGDVYAVAVSPDSRLLAAASADGKTRIYTLADGKLLVEVPR